MSLQVQQKGEAYSVVTFIKAKYILIEKCLPFCFYVQHSDPINSSKYICLFSGDQRSKVYLSLYTMYYLKLDDKVRLDREQSGNSEPFPVTNFPVYFQNTK